MNFVGTWHICEMEMWNKEYFGDSSAFSVHKKKIEKLE